MMGDDERVFGNVNGLRSMMKKILATYFVPQSCGKPHNLAKK